MAEKARAMARELPSSPGCYLMKDSGGEVIYVGKAKNLKRRVASYFLPNRNAKTAALVDKIDTIDYIITGNEYERAASSATAPITSVHIRSSPG